MDRVSKHFSAGRSTTAALRDASLRVAEREFVTLVGPSGCGKSTLFNIIAGLLEPTTGTVEMDGRRIDGKPGSVGYMMQRDCLMQWRSIIDNVVLGIEVLGEKRTAARARALAVFPKFGLAGYERQPPSALSGGMRQRAALLRTLLLDREVMLLDEPFGALDAITRSEMQEWLLSIWSEFRRTVLFITHDVEEAIYLSDRVYVMLGSPGRIHAEVTVDIPRPRVYEDVIAIPEFARLKQHVLHLIRAQTEVSAAS